MIKCIARLTLITVCLIAVGTGGMAKQADRNPDVARSFYGKPIFNGSITDPEINEASGLAYSLSHPGVLWVINDSGNQPILYGITQKGNLLGRFIVAGASNRDWEDLAPFSFKGKSHLMIADVGDNRALRNTCLLYVVEEPDISGVHPDTPETIQLKKTIKFGYSDGPRDCEAVGVDMKKNSVLLISKRTTPPVLYQLPLNLHDTNDHTTDGLIARPIAAITSIPRPTRQDLKSRYGKLWSRPTAMDLMPGGRTMIILTYKNAYRYTRQRHGTWADAFKHSPETILLPHPDTREMVIREALCINPGTMELFTTSEGSPAPIYSVKPGAP